MNLFYLPSYIYIMWPQNVRAVFCRKEFGKRMSYGLRYVVEKRKKQLIEKLIDVGIYKVLNKQLYELTLDELEKEYEDLLKYEGVRTSIYTS